MIFLAISLFITTLVTGFLVNKWLDMVKVDNDRKFVVNNENHYSAQQLNELIAEYREQISNYAALRQEFDNLKTLVGLKRH